jgi:hypothetical protein
MHHPKAAAAVAAVQPNDLVALQAARMFDAADVKGNGPQSDILWCFVLAFFFFFVFFNEWRWCCRC